MQLHLFEQYLYAKPSGESWAAADQRETTPEAWAVRASHQKLRSFGTSLRAECRCMLYPRSVVPILTRTSPGLSKHRSSSLSPCVSQLYTYAPGQRWKKCDLIRKEFGLSKGELGRHLGISRQSALPVHLGRSAATCCFGNPLVMVSGSHGELFEELSEPEKETTRKSKGRQENCGAKRRS